MRDREELRDRDDRSSQVVITMSPRASEGVAHHGE
jgi:hypothetical protein